MEVIWVNMSVNQDKTGEPKIFLSWKMVGAEESRFVLYPTVTVSTEISQPLMEESQNL